MAYSTLKRKTPLRAKTGFKPAGGFKGKAAGRQPDGTGEKPARGRKAAKTELSGLVTRLDAVFSLYIRLRDAMPNGTVRCISCGGVFPFAQIQCGHYFTRHNMSVRWDERNCHAQCVECNCHKSGNIAGYTPRLVSKIGREAYDALCVSAHGMRKWGGDELKAMIRHYTAEARLLAREKGMEVRI